MGLPKALHGAVALLAFAGAAASVGVAVRMGALTFLKENIWDGLLTDFLAGLFLQPIWMAALFGLPLVPAVLIVLGAPKFLLAASCIVGFPFAVVFVAIIIEALVVLIPTGAAAGVFALVGWVEADHARGKRPAVLKLFGGGRKKKGRPDKAKGAKDE